MRQFIAYNPVAMLVPCGDKGTRKFVSGKADD